MRPSLESLYVRHHRLVRWLVVGGCIPAHAVDDVVQDVFVAIHRRLDRAPTDDLRPWIVGVVRSVCHAHRRGAARRCHRLARVALDDAAPALDDVVEQRCALGRVQAVLADIEPEQREAFVLVELHGLSAPEAADALGANLNTVYSRVRLARRKIEAAFAGPQRALAAARAEGHATPQARQRVWLAIGAQLGLEPSAAVVAAASSKLAWLGACATLLAAPLVGALVGAGLGAREREPIAVVAEAQADDTPAVRHSPSDADEAAPALQVLAVAAHVEPATIGGEIAEASVEIVAPSPLWARPRRAASHAPSSAAPDAVAAEPAGTTTETELLHETRLLREAARALDAGDHAGCADALAAHARDHRHGMLAAERQRLQDRLERNRSAS